MLQLRTFLIAFFLLLQAADVVIRGDISDGGGDIEVRNGRAGAGTVQAVERGVEDLLALGNVVRHLDGEVEVLTLVGKFGAQVLGAEDLADVALVAGRRRDAESNGDIVHGLDVDLVDHDGGEGVAGGDGGGNLHAVETCVGGEDGEGGGKNGGGAHFVDCLGLVERLVCNRDE